MAMDGSAVMLSSVGMLFLMAFFGLRRWRKLRKRIRKMAGMETIDRADHTEWGRYSGHRRRNAANTLRVLP